MVDSRSSPSLDEVEQSVAALLARLNAIDESTVRDNLAGSGSPMPFDSILGVELAAGLEAELGIVIPQRVLQRTQTYKSLRAFTDAVFHGLSEAYKGGTDPNDRDTL
jgi:acyl carrier protein